MLGVHLCRNEAPLHTIRRGPDIPRERPPEQPVLLMKTYDVLHAT